MKATKTRSAIKSVVWRMIAIAITFGVLYPFLGWHKLIIATVVIHIAKTIAYYIHERFWANIPWGYE